MPMICYKAREDFEKHRLTACDVDPLLTHGTKRLANFFVTSMSVPNSIGLRSADDDAAGFVLDLDRILAAECLEMQHFVSPLCGYC